MPLAVVLRRQLLLNPARLSGTCVACNPLPFEACERFGLVVTTTTALNAQSAELNFFIWKQSLY